VCREMAEVNADVKELYRMENGRLGKTSYGNFKDDVKKRADYFTLAENVVT
jgi:hypothetical protein